jgi:hypothetical protein
VVWNRSTSNQHTTIAGFHELGEYRTATPEHNPMHYGFVDDDEQAPAYRRRIIMRWCGLVPKVVSCSRQPLQAGPEPNHTGIKALLMPFESAVRS